MSGRRRRGGAGSAPLAFAASCVAVLAGCNSLIGADAPSLRSEDGSAAATCVLNSDCTTAGQVCIFRVCSPPCHDDVDCATGSRCLQTSAGTACVANGVATCGSGQSCPAGAACLGGACRNGCHSSADCAGSQQCLDGVCIGTNPSHDPGSVDSGVGAVGDGPSEPPDATSGTDAGTNPSDGSTSADVATTGDATTEDAPTQAADGASDGALDASADVTPDVTLADAGAEAGCGGPTDIHNCGVCGHDCTKLPNVSAAGLGCSSGQCTYTCASGHADCSNTGTGCATDLSSTSSCGACSTSCSTATPVCSPSSMAPGGFACASGCPASAPTLCGSTCVDLMTNSSNCNGCGQACPTNEQCVAGSCECPSPDHLCGGACVANDDSACGAACTSCAATAPSGGTASCNGTMCVGKCNVSTDSICSSVCVDETQNGNCAACGVTCSGNTPYCAATGCVECTGTQMQCTTGNTPQTCSGDTWVSAAPCAGSTPVCVNGACVACTNGSTRCDPTNTLVQVCSGNGWTTQTTCSSGQICRMAGCVNAIHDVGWDTTLSGNTYNLSANFLYIFRLPKLTAPATLLAFGAYGAGSTGTNAQMVLYGDNGSGTAPSGAALAATSSSMIISNMNVQQTPSPTNFALAASTYYWLGIVVQSATTIYEQSDSAEVGTGFGDTFGTTPWPAGMAGLSKSGVDIAIYINVQDTQ